MTLEQSTLCRKPDSKGTYNLRCIQIIMPKGESEPRQCRAAACAGTWFCGVHTEET